MSLHNSKLNVYQVDGFVYNEEGTRNYKAELLCLAWTPITLLPEAVVLATVNRRFIPKINSKGVVLV